MGIIDWFKRQTLEGKIERHVGEVSSSNRKPISSKLSIDVLEPRENPSPGRVRIGITMTSFASYQSFGIVLTNEEAKALAALLIESSSKN